jgi:predicted kinase
LTAAPTLFITCGLQGSGKTTLAKRLEFEHSALRLTADEWLHELHPEVAGAELDALRDPVERVQWRVATRALELGCNVVLDWGLWSREERDHYRLQARALGARVVLCLADASREELLDRLSRRNAERPPGTFHITEARLDQSMTFFERPTQEEIALFDPEAP